MDMASPNNQTKTSDNVFCANQECKGVSTVENAIFLPVFLFLVLGFFQLAIWGFGIAVADLAAREGCRTGAVWYQDLLGLPKGLAKFMGEDRAHVWLGMTGFTSGAGVSSEFRESGIGPGVEGTREYSVTISMNFPSVIPLIINPRGDYQHTVTCRFESYHP